MQVSSLVNRVIASSAFVVATLAIGRLGPRRLLLGCYAGAVSTSALMTVWASDPSWPKCRLGGAIAGHHGLLRLHRKA